MCLAARSLIDQVECADLPTNAYLAVTDALESFRDKRATVGRARIFGDKSVGLDDPGMLAMERIVKALVDRET